MGACSHRGHMVLVTPGGTCFASVKTSVGPTEAEQTGPTTVGPSRGHGHRVYMSFPGHLGGTFWKREMALEEI